MSTIKSLKDRSWIMLRVIFFDLFFDSGSFLLFIKIIAVSSQTKTFLS